MQILKRKTVLQALLCLLLDVYLAVKMRMEAVFTTGLNIEKHLKNTSLIKSDPILMAIPDALILVDASGVINDINPAAACVFNYKADALRGKSIKLLLPHLYVKHSKAASEKYFSITPGVLSEGIAKRGDASIFPVEINLGEISDRENLLILVIRDITDRKLLEKDTDTDHEVLKKVNSELEEFSSITAHDLKDPLRKIKYFSGKLSQSQECLSSKNKINIERINSYAETMTKLIDGLLGYAKSCADLSDVKSVDLNSVIEKVAFEFKDTLKDLDAKIEWGELPSIIGERIKLEQLFRNFISNSIKYRDEGRRLEIMISSEQKNANRPEKNTTVVWHNIIVQDNGQGVSIDDINRIFRPFSREVKNNDNGVGLGLSVCKKIVEMHHGKISACSEKDKGMSIHISIPVCDIKAIAIKDAA